MKKRKIILTFLTILLMGGSSISGQEVPQEPQKPAKPFVEHLPGDFFFKILFGYGLGEGTVNYSDSTVTTIENSQTVFVDLQLGMAVINNLVVFGEMGTTGVRNGDIVIDGVGDTVNRLERFNMPAFGIGALYFFMPYNIYAGGQIRFPQLRYDIKHPNNEGIEVYTSKFGVGFGLTAGIEFAFSKTMATGIAVVFLYDFPQPRYNTIDSIENYFIGLSATLTYN